MIHLGITTVCRSFSVQTNSKYPNEATLDFLGYMIEMHEVTAACRTFDYKVVTVVLMEALQGFNEEKIGGEPDRATPVGIAAKHARMRIAGPVSNSKFFTIDSHGEGMVFVVLGKRTDTVIAQEFRFVQHPLQDPDKPVLASQREENPALCAMVGVHLQLTLRDFWSTVDEFL
jgi:hypothetical protein